MASSGINIANLPVAIGVTGDDDIPIDQAGVTKRAKASAIANTATGFVPTSRRVDAGVGLSGGGTLASDVTIDFAPDTLFAATTMAAGDTFVIQQALTGTPRQIVFADAMKGIGVLPSSPPLNLTADKFLVLRAADGETYSATATQISIAAGNVPAGGTTGQVLAKLSSTNYDTAWISNSITLDPLSIAANPTGVQATSTSVTLGATLAFSGTSLRTAAGTGDVVWSANSFVTTISNNAVTDAKFRQSVAVSVVGNATNATANVADIAGTANQILRVSGAGTALAFGAIDLAQSASVGTSILTVPNGGTGVASTTAYALLAGGTTSTGALQSLSGVGTSGQVLVSNGAGQLPTWQTATTAIGQALTRVDDTNVTLTLGGAPTTALLSATSLTLGWTGQLSLTRGGTAASLTASNGGIVYSTASAMAILAGTATAGQHLQSGSSAAPSWTTATFPSTAAAGTILAAGTANTITATATPTLGVAGTTLGSLAFAGNTSGTVTIQPQAAAGTYNFNLPTSAGTSGQPLLSGGGGATAMSFGTLGIAGGGTAATSFTAYAVLCGGTTSTGALQSVASVGTSGQILTSNGAGALPTFQSATSALGQALTKADDTNVTLTLGGAPTTALLSATSLTLGWTGQLGLTRGGTNASLTASNGGIIYSTASALAVLAGTATANQVLLSGSSTTPAWSTATYPATTTINQLLYSSSANVIAGLATANGGMLNASSSGVPSMTITPTLGVQQTSRGSLTLANTAAGAFAATIQSSNSATAATTLTLPPDAGTSGYVLSTNGSGVLSWVSVGGTGTVTSVSFTGGLISVATATTTPALTVAGTSGGIPYFSSASTWASSAALAANALVIGGGAGVAPSTTTTGSGVLTALSNNIGAAGSVLVTNNTATITKGFTVTPNNIGTVSSGTTTLDPTNGNYQYLSNNGAFTLAAPSSDCAIDLLVTNAGSAGAITFSGFTVGSSTGSPLTTTNTNKFIISVRRINGTSTYSIYALQ